MTANVETLAYVADRGTPWHGLGTPVEELMTSEQALVAAELDWEVTLQPISVLGGQVIDDRYATVRSSDGKPLGIVGNRYVPVQNREAFAWADALVDDGQAKYETAGALRGGQWVFMSMELNHLEINVPGDPSAMKSYLLVFNGHDGQHALEGLITHVRVVCQNTLMAARGSAKKSFRIRHTGSLDGKLAAAREALGVSFRNTEYVAEIAGKLAGKQLLDKQVREILAAVWPAADSEDEDALSRNAEGAFENYVTSDTLTGIRGTAWGAFNAVTEFLDHETTYRARTYDAANVRFDSLLFGSAQDAKDRALALLLKS